MFIMMHYNNSVGNKPACRTFLRTLSVFFGRKHGSAGLNSNPRYGATSSTSREILLLRFLMVFKFQVYMSAGVRGVATSRPVTESLVQVIAM